MAATYDLVIRDGKVATAADVFVCDIGIKGGRIAALGHDLPKGEDEIDARGRLVLPGGIDGHIHVSQDLFDDWELADDFSSALCRRSAAALRPSSPSPIRPRAPACAPRCRNITGARMARPISTTPST
jgi:predicted amidohydrolase YtcJ